MGQVISAAVLTAGLRNTFADAYQLTTEARISRLGKVMELGVPSDKREEFYAYFETAPYPKRWPRGRNISEKPFDSQDFSVVNYDWGRRISWHENDREDDQTQSLFAQAKSLGRHFATLHERIFFQMILAATNLDLLPAVPNSPDGAAIYSATDGAAAARFGVTGGNIVTGTGVLNPSSIQNDFLNGIERFKQFQDTEGQPLWDEAMLDGGGYCLIYNVANDANVRRGLKASTYLARDPGGNAAVANIVLEEGVSVELWPTQRVTTDDLYLFAKGCDHKCVFQQERKALRESVAGMDNSDHVRDTKEEYLQYDSRYGYGAFLPYQTVQINN